MSTRQVLFPAIAIFGLLPMALGAVQLMQLIAAQHALAVGVRAGALEATLPRATCASVRAAVRRSLAQSRMCASLDGVTIQRNGRPLLGPLIPPLSAGDKMTVVVSLPALAVTADYLELIGWSLCGRRVLAACTRCMPDGRLP